MLWVIGYLEVLGGRCLCTYLFCWCHWVHCGPRAEMTPQNGCYCAGASPERVTIAGSGVKKKKLYPPLQDCLFLLISFNTQPAAWGVWCGQGAPTNDPSLAVHQKWSRGVWNTHCGYTHIVLNWDPTPVTRTTDKHFIIAVFRKRLLCIWGFAVF